MKVVQMGFKLSIPSGEFRQSAASIARALAEVPGLRWKIWLLNEAAGVAGGVCLFEDEISRDAFLSSELAAQIQTAPFHRGMEIKLFDVMPEVTALTRGPVSAVTML